MPSLYTISIHHSIIFVSVMKQTMMGMLLHFLSVLLGVLTVLDLIQGQDQSGFTSIDCGLPDNSDYTEKITGINYISDAKFIDTGVSKSISAAEMITHQQQLHYVRSFPIGVRNCYRVNVNIGFQYLVRATFYYGNYDGLNKPPQFELHFGVNVWDTVKFSNASRTVMSEIIYIPSQDYMQPCLVNIGKGTPFISAIELRTLNNNSYVTDADLDKPVLSLFRRYDLGSITDLEYRYKDDVYDRIWLPYELSSDWRRLNISLNNDDLLQNRYKPPSIVLNTAVTPVNVSAPLHFEWDADNVNDQYYVYIHIYDFEEPAANEIREFNITVNGKFLYGPERPRYPVANTVYSTLALTPTAKRYHVTLSKTENSTLPPILNAIEVYKVKDFSQSETQHDDVDTVTNIKNAYGVARNWQGDPCAPARYTWEGLNCSFNGLNSPRIISLNLSSSGLTGQIHYSISQLTMLQYLDLSNNSLNGPLPVFLNKLKSLKVLNVGKNKLTGLVPIELLERSKTGSLSLSVDDNPGLRTTESSTNKNLSIPLIASFSALNVVILLISLGFWIFRRQRVLSTNCKEKGAMKLRHQAFSYIEILSITDNFKTIIGEGGFGKVYLGVLKDHTQVAVKILSPSSMQGYKEFQSEAQLLLIVHHRNLVSLIGFCDEGETKALIYEYMANGNLQHYLGLDYLHNGCKPPIMHRDLKPSNILLDENMDAKISDFGLSRAFGSDIDTHISTRPAGTLGYADPEYQRTGNTNKKNDVYSFGIVLFVLITGRQAIVRTAGENIHILEWVMAIIKGGNIQNVVDSKLEGEFNIDSARKVVEIAMSCISPIVAERPDISQIFVELKESLSLEMVQRARERENNVIEWNSSQFQSVTAPFPR